jgi:UDP-3-O-[3-hydroxymyristoyl] glucosamine N-acyltransferase
VSVPLPPGTTLGQISDVVTGTVSPQQRSLAITGLAPLDRAQSGDIGFCASTKAARALPSFRGSALLLSESLESLAPAAVPCVLVSDAYLGYARISQWIAQTRRALHAGEAAAIHASAVVDPTASLGAGVVLGPGVVIGARARIGAGTDLRANVVVQDDCEIGERCLVHPGTVIGADGFGFAPSPQGWVKIEQLGRVRIGNDVEIGANCAIDRGALDDTVIGHGTKLDNLIQVAHNVVIGEHCAIAGCVGIAGSAVIGNRVQIGGGAGILGHLSICDDVIISSMTLVASSIRDPGFYTGVYPLASHSEWEKSAAALRHLPDLRRRLRALEQNQSKDF